MPSEVIVRRVWRGAGYPGILRRSDVRGGARQMIRRAS